MRKTQIFLQCFVTVTTGIVFIAALAYRNVPEHLTAATLWQILLAAALCALSTALLFPGEHTSKRRARVGIVLHFLSLCAIMVACGRWFGWIGAIWPEAAVMVGYVAIVYGFTTGVTFLTTKHQADALNRKLHQKYPDGE